MMVECHPNLFISDLESISSLVDALESNEISYLLNYPSLIVSIGCEVELKGIKTVTKSCDSNLKPSTTILTYSSVLDDPSYCLIPLWNDVLPVMQKTLSDEGSVIVHCVHGQSRSVSTVIAYMIKIQNIPILEAFQHVKESHTNTCINPGFLSQLFFFASSQQSGAPYKLMLEHYRHYVARGRRKTVYWGEKAIVDEGLVPYASPNSLASSESPFPLILCKNCKSPQVSDRDSVIKLSLDSREFVERQVDAYWKDFWLGRMRNKQSVDNSQHLRPIALPHKHYVALYPSEWMREQTCASSALRCPSCHTVIGGWKENGLDLCIGSDLTQCARVLYREV
eukprot:gene26198-31637_t